METNDKKKILIIITKQNNQGIKHVIPKGSWIGHKKTGGNEGKTKTESLERNHAKQ